MLFRKLMLILVLMCFLMKNHKRFSVTAKNTGNAGDMADTAAIQLEGMLFTQGMEDAKD